MNLRLKTLTLLAGTSLLAACTAFQAEPIYNSASAAKPPAGDAYHTALYQGYMEHATYEYDKMMNYTSAIYHSNKALAAARGQTPPITAVNERSLPADSIEDVTQGRARLVAALEGGGAQAAPEAAGKAQSFYDCWLEQLHENFQPKDIEYCRNGFLTNLKTVEDAVIPKAADTYSLSSDTFFALGSAKITPAGLAELQRIAPDMIADTNSYFDVWGFTDTTGTAAYNQKLSERRAAAVKAQLVSDGVPEGRLFTQGFGETNLAVQTPDNTPEPRNRRVEIRRRAGS
ncbi:MAG: OmpA family protein [Geminicoccaceae bacterium]